MFQRKQVVNADQNKLSFKQKLEASKKAKAEKALAKKTAKTEKSLALKAVISKAEFLALTKNDQKKLKKIFKKYPALVNELNSADTSLTLEVILKLNEEKFVKQFAESLATQKAQAKAAAIATPAVTEESVDADTNQVESNTETNTAENQDSVNVEINLDAEAEVEASEAEEITEEAVAKAPVAKTSKFKARMQAVKSLKTKDDVSLLSEVKLRSIMKKYPELTAIIGAEYSPITAQMILDIKQQGGLKTFVANVKDGFMDVFAPYLAALDANRRIQLAKMDNKKFNQLKAFFAAAKECGNKIVEGRYIDALVELNDTDFAAALNIDPSFLNLVFIKKTHAISDALKVERKVNDENTPVAYKQEVVASHINLDLTVNYIKDCIEVARAQANKMNHWYYWNGRSKAQQIFAAISSIENQYLAEKAGSLPPFTAAYALQSFKADGGKSLTEALSTRRYFSFFGSKAKETKSMQLLNAVPAPKI